MIETTKDWLFHTIWLRTITKNMINNDNYTNKGQHNVPWINFQTSINATWLTSKITIQSQQQTQILHRYQNKMGARTQRSVALPLTDMHEGPWTVFERQTHMLKFSRCAKSKQYKNKVMGLEIKYMMIMLTLLYRCNWDKGRGSILTPLRARNTRPSQRALGYTMPCKGEDINYPCGFVTIQVRRLTT